MAFDMIKEFPESSGALEDLRECLEKTSRFTQLRDELIAAIGRRLLSVGVSTSDILMAFVKVVKAMRVIDPTDVLLEAMSSPIREYLKKRKDTVQCVVAAFVKESWEDIIEAFRQKPLAPEDVDPYSWVPEPITPEPVIVARAVAQQPRAADIVSLLEGLWGGTDAFVDAYAAALGSSLLALTDWEAEKELRQLELLKVRFGEGVMQACEVMLRDVAESRRLAQQLPAVAEAFSFSATVISHMYWPDNVKEEDSATYESLPAPIRAAMDSFAAEYTKLKPTRKLQWIGSQGQVTVEVEVPGSDMPVDFRVSPTLAMVVLCFSEQPTWSSTDLSERLSISLEVARKSIAFWISKGVLSPSRSESDVFCVCSPATAPTSPAAPTPEVIEAMSGMASPTSPPSEATIDVDDEISGILLGLLITGTGLTMNQLIAGVSDLMPEVVPSAIRAHVDALVKCSKLTKSADTFEANPDAP
jgi:anaphase-promoting complex subunit 2